MKTPIHTPPETRMLLRPAVPSRSAIHLGAGLAALALSAAPAAAVTSTWSGAFTNGSWTDQRNWDETAPNGTTSDALFYASGAQRLNGPGYVVLGNSITIRSVTFSANAAEDVWINLTGTNYTSGRTLAFEAAEGNASITVESGASGNFVFGYSGNGQVNLVDDLDLAHHGTGTLSFNRPVQDVGGINKTGSGTMLLNAVNTYAGVTTVSGGILGGSGRLTGTIILDAGGAVAPGTSIGTLTGTSLTWNSNDALVGMIFDLSSSDNTSDLLSLTGAFAKGTGSSFLFDFVGGLGGETYTLVDFGSSDFSVDDFAVASGIGGSFTLNGNSLQFIAVPEPATPLLLLGLAAGLAARRVRTPQVAQKP